MPWLVNLSDEKFSKSRHRQNHSAPNFGIDKIASWTWKDLLTTPFYLQHQSILDQPRGLGYWLWKPFIINHLMERVSDGEAIAYADAGLLFLRHLQPLVDFARANRGYGIMWQPHRNHYYTKRKCFEIMGCDRPEFHRMWQCDASFMIFNTNPETRCFVREWLYWCCHKEVIIDDLDKNYDHASGYFRDHRHDQSVLTILCRKYSVLRIPQLSDQIDTALGWQPGIPKDLPWPPPGGGGQVHHHREQGETTSPEDVNWRGHLQLELAKSPIHAQSSTGHA